MSSLPTEEEKAEEERVRKEQFKLDMINAAAERERRAKRKGVVEELELARCGVDGDGLAALVSVGRLFTHLSILMIFNNGFIANLISDRQIMYYHFEKNNEWDEILRSDS